MIRATLSIHPTAVIHPSARVGLNTTIGEFALVETGAVIGDNCHIASHAIVRADVELGDEVRVDSFAVIGGQPQMTSHTQVPGRICIGARTIVREGVTVNRPTKDEGITSVGTDCYLMANSHIGHDSLVGNSVTLANNVMLAGHVTVGDFVFFGGGAGVHQFVRIGEGAMIGGNASISYDVPPFAIAAERNEISGLNLVGIRRRGMAKAAIADLKRCFHAVFCGTGNVRVRAADALATESSGCEPEGRRFLEFFAGGRRGFVQQRTQRQRDSIADDDAS